MLFLSSLDNLLLDANIIFQKSVDNFLKKAQNMLIWGRRCSTPLMVQFSAVNLSLLNPLARIMLMVTFISFIVQGGGLLKGLATEKPSKLFNRFTAENCTIFKL